MNMTCVFTKEKKIKLKVGYPAHMEKILLTQHQLAMCL